MSSSNKTSLPKSYAEGLVPLWWKNQTWRDNLAKKAAHQAIGIPEDDMNINNTKSGIGALGAIGIALAAGLPAAGLAGMMFMNQGSAKVVPPIPTVAAVQQQDSEWDVEELLADDKGNIVQPEKVVKRTRYRSRSGVVEKKLPDGTWERVK